MILGCIDIGSNTTRLLVAEVRDGALRELAAERVFTSIRKSLDPAGRIPAAKVVETVGVVAAQARRARALGAAEIVAVATAAIRAAPNGRELGRGVEQAIGVPLRVISGEQEARLSFLGATRTLPPVAGRVAVVDVGGGSTEIAVGTADGGVEWWRSLAIGSAVLADRHLRSDPPTAGELEAARRQAAVALDGLAAPVVESVVAVGGTATSLLRVLVGGALGPDTLERGVRLLSEAPIAELAGRLGLEAERVRLLPAGMLVLKSVAERLGPLQVARGGLREGVILELVEQRARGG